MVVSGGMAAVEERQQQHMGDPKSSEASSSVESKLVAGLVQGLTRNRYARIHLMCIARGLWRSWERVRLKI